MTLTLDETQAAVLRELLDSALRDLSYEISNTDNPAFKRGLRARADSMRAVLEALGAP